MNALVLACFVVVVVCGRLGLVFYAGSPIPFHDQWYAEAHGVLIPYFRHVLTFESLFVTHGDHVIALTRALTLGLALWEGKWDPISQMAVNCVISPFCLLPLMAWAVVRYGRRVAGSLCLVVGVVYGSPLFYGNIIWGFQSQILLMVAFSMAHLYLLVVRPGGWVRWSVAMLCGLLSAISFGSGFVAALVAALALLANWRRMEIGLVSRLATLAGCGGIVVLALWLSPAHPLLKEIRFAALVHTFVHALSFPGRFFSWWGPLFWIPAAGALTLAVTQAEWRSKVLFPLAAVVWCLGQILAISLGRSAVAPRYYDFLMIGVLANGCLAFELLEYSRSRRGVRNVIAMGAVVWAVAIGYQTVKSTAEHTLGDVPVLATRAAQQTQLVTRYYAEQRNPEILRTTAFPIRPWPEPEFLDETLRQPEIAALWPSYILEGRVTQNVRELPWLGERIPRTRWFRGSLLVGIGALAGLCATILWALFEKIRGPSALRVENRGEANA